MSRIGIYPGTFDPVHVGHVTFAIQASQAANLDKLYFMPERRPRDKKQVEHFAHRAAMIRQAIRPYPKFGLIELTDISFSVEKTLTKLNAEFSNDQLVFLFGSDIIEFIPSWPKSERLLESSELIVGLRHNTKSSSVDKIIRKWSNKPKDLLTLDSFAPEVSSGKIRQALRTNKSASGVLKSVKNYSNHNWLYVSLV